MMKKRIIIDAQTGYQTEIGKSLFMNELLLDEKGRKVSSPEKAKSKVYYYSTSSLTEVGKHPNTKEVNIALYLLQQFIHHITLCIRTEIVSLNSSIRNKMRTYKRHIFIIRTHPLFDKVKKPQVFKKLSKLIEIPLIDLRERLKVCSSKFKKDERSYLKSFPKRITLKPEELELDETEESEGETQTSSLMSDPFLVELEKDKKKENNFNELMETDDEDNILLSISSSDEDFEEKIAEKLEKEKEKKEKKKNEERNLRTPIPVQTEEQKKIQEVMDWIHPFEKAMSTLKRIKRDSKKSEFRPHVPGYIFSLLEEIRRREKVLRILYFKLQDLQSSVARENEIREGYSLSGMWKRKKDYENPTEEEKEFLVKKIPEIKISQVMDPRYYELFQSTADGGVLEEMVSPISEEDKRKHMTVSTGGSGNSDKNNSNNNKKDFGYITTEDLLKCLKEREAELADKNEELAQKVAKIKKLGKSLGETQVSHNETRREAREYEGMIEKMNETMVENQEKYKENLDGEKRRYRSLEMQSSQMETMYNAKIEEMEVLHSQELRKTMARIKKLELEITETKDELDKKIKTEEEKKKSQEVEKRLKDLTEKYEIEKKKIERKIDELELEIAEKRKLYESEKLKSTDLTETIIVHKTEAENLDRQINQLRASLKDSVREAGEANRKYENGLKFVGNVVKLIDEKDEKIKSLENVVTNLLKQLQIYWKSEDEKKVKKKKSVRFDLDKDSDDSDSDSEFFF